ncbi:MAG: amidohydrolase [Dysgonamonadaceae bacterium]|jgi:predicted amidohydrolase|nr:amidohydrolase [Dysgonamonadaceae bacterium]
MDVLRVSLVQSTVFWEDKSRNIEHYGALLKPLTGKTDLAVLPEMFSTGFSVNGSNHLAETREGRTVEMIRKWAEDYHFAICGSFLSGENDKLYNRGFFVTPEGDAFFYDKRHLFRMGDENKNFTAGDKQLIVSYKGWNICLIVCYDLRFPVWSRNTAKAYDLLICPANWPRVRKNTWNILLKARALENYCYVCGVNRIGEDGHHNHHEGESQLIDFKGDVIAFCDPDKEMTATGFLQKEVLDHFREKFPVWRDADEFEVIFHR